MTAASTADRIVRDGYLATDMAMEKGVADLRDLLTKRVARVVVADNVADYVRRNDKRYAVGEWPCLTSPWTLAWIEYPSNSGKQRRGIYVMGVDLHDPTMRAEGDRLRTGVVGGAIANAEEQSPGVPVRHVLVMAIFTDDGTHVAGPMGTLVWALDERGKELGNRWYLRNKATGGWELSADIDAEWLYAASLPALQTIAFCHCRNVRVEGGRTEAKLAKAYRKRHGTDPLRFQTVRLELPRRESQGGGTGEGDAKALHIVDGYFAHFGDCCPSVHEPHGLAFGKLTGVYWVPQHARGKSDAVVVSDRVARVR